MSPRSPGAAGGFLVSEDKCMQLFIGNRNYSSWSLRAWLVLRHFGIRFEERLMLLHGAGWQRKLRQVSPTGRVPVGSEGGSGGEGGVRTCKAGGSPRSKKKKKKNKDVKVTAE